MGPLSTWKEATSIYSTWRSVESAGYWDFDFFAGGGFSVYGGNGCIEGVDEGVLELLTDG